MTKNRKTDIKTHVNYPVGDFLVRLKNAAIAGNKEIELSTSKLIKNVALALKKEGLLASVEEKSGNLTVILSYRKKEPVLMDVKLVSKPGLRIYIGVDELAKKRGPSVLILSTPIGVITGKDAIKKRVGGELIAEIL